MPKSVMEPRRFRLRPSKARRLAASATPDAPKWP